MATRVVDLGSVIGPQGPAGPQGEPGAGSSPNLLDNWYFADPINRRGETTKTGAGNGGYMIDRWKSTSGYLTQSLENGGLRLTTGRPTGYVAELVQVGEIHAGTYTLSVLVAQMYSGAFRIRCGSAYSDIISAPGLYEITTSLDGDIRGGDIVVISTAGTSGFDFLCAAMKLELGSQQTLAHQDADGNWVLNDPPPDKTLEALKIKGRPADMDGGGGVKLSARAARFVVGTSTAGWTAADCDYLCDGENDQAEINAAIQALPAGGGEVLLLDGTYRLTGSVAVNKANTVLRGNGPSTVVDGDYQASDGAVILSAERTTVRDMKVTTSDGNAVSLWDADYMAVRDCYILCATGEMDYSTTALSIHNASDCVITGNWMEADRVARVVGGTYLLVTGNVTLSAEDDLSAYITGASNIVANNVND